MSLLYVVVGLAIVLLASLAISRIGLPRKASIEGIDDEEVAEAFNRVSLWPQFRLLRRMVIRQLSIHHPTGAIVDIGCGPGYLVEEISRRLPETRIIGIDYAKEMVETGKRRAETSDSPNKATFLQGDVEKIPLGNESVDFVVSSLSLHHWSNPIAGFAEIYRVLRPDGQLLVFDLRRDSTRMFYCLLRFAQALIVPRALHKVNEPLGSLLAAYSVTELKGMMEKTPFKEYKVTGGVGWAYVWAGKTKESG
jgi:ubiquinone/menaquinone biosynthesis C-methylase UbiE